MQILQHCFVSANCISDAVVAGTEHFACADSLEIPACHGAGCFLELLSNLFGA